MYEGAGEEIPSLDVPAQLIQGRRSLHRIAFVLGLGGAALLAWHIFQRLKLAKERAKDDAKKAALTTKNEIKVNGGDSVRPLETNNNRPGLVRSHAIIPPVKVTIHQCPRGYLTPCISPFSLKLETYLRINGIPYEVDCATSGEDGNVPWMTIGGEDVRESHDCISKINQALNINLDAGAPQSRLIASRLVSIMLENHIYWGIALWRWVYDQGRTLPHIQPLSATSMATIDDIGQSVNRAAWYHGLGRLSPQQVTDVILKDLGDLSSALGKHPFFMGDSPGEVDCGAFAMLSQMVWNMPGSPFEPAVKQYRNLVDFVLRMRDNFYPDWQSLVQVRGEEDNLEGMGIFPGSEFLHKRQLNSDSSHWDSKGSSSITLKQVKVKPAEVKSDFIPGTDRDSRQNHVTFEQSSKGQQEENSSEMQPPPIEVAGVQSLPHGILRPKPASASSSVSSPGQGQSTLDPQEALLSNQASVPMQASSASIQTNTPSMQNVQQFQQQQQQQQFQQLEASKFQGNLPENLGIQQQKFGGQIPMIYPSAHAPFYPHGAPMYPNFGYQMPPPPEYSDVGRPGSGFQGQGPQPLPPNFFPMHPYGFQGYQPPPTRSGLIFEGNNNGAFGSNSSSDYGPSQQQSNRQF